MAEHSKIEWTEATWNPWHGCHKISPGCKNCYMFRDKARYGQDGNVVVKSKTKFTEPLRWKDPRVVFTCSWSDWFIEEADQWREEAYEVIRRTPQHTYQILTKRIERAEFRFPAPPPPNVWLGVSVESSKYLGRVDMLREVPAAVRFLSVEPLLEDLGQIDLTGIHWVIVGGESGPNARAMHAGWVRSIKDQCIAAGVPFFFKQWGEWIPVSQHDFRGFNPGVKSQAMEDALFAHVGKKAAGRLLDGREWSEMPKEAGANG